MTTHVQSPIARFISPQISNDSTVEYTSKPDEAARFAEEQFDMANGRCEAAEFQRNYGHRTLASESRELDRAEKHREQTPAIRSFPTQEIIAPLSMSQRVQNGLTIVAVVSDPLLSLWTASNYMAASGKLPDVAGSPASAGLLCGIFYVAIFGIKALGDNKDTELERKRFTNRTLVIGLIAALGAIGMFALVFNPTSIQSGIDSSNLGASASSQNDQINYAAAVALVALQLIATIGIGGGLALSLRYSLDKNKVLRVLDHEEYLVADARVQAQRARCSDASHLVLEATVSIANHNAARAAAARSFVNDVREMKRVIDTETAHARTVVTEKLAKSGLSPSSKKAH